MGLGYLTMNVYYDIGTDEFEITGEADRRKQYMIIKEFLNSQNGDWDDNCKVNEKANYNIQLKWRQEEKIFECSSDTGDKGLRDGILTDVLSRLRR